MKAMSPTGHGGPEMMNYGDAADPKAGPGEVVVDIHAASVNAADYKVRGAAGRYSSTSSRTSWVAISRAWSAQAGRRCHRPRRRRRRVRRDRPGQRRHLCGKDRDQGRDRRQEARALSHAEAAALGLISLTALTAHRRHGASSRAGETILIQGGAGGVAGFAIQLAKHIGATVITTASAANHDYVRGLGADRVIDYNKEDFTAMVRSATWCSTPSAATCAPAATRC